MPLPAHALLIVALLLLVALLFQAARSVARLLLEMRASETGSSGARDAPSTSLGVLTLDRHGALESRQNI